MTHRSRPILCLPLLLLSIALTTAVSAEPAADSVTASVTFLDGQQQQYDLSPDTTLEIKTCVGDLEFECTRVTSIDSPIDTDLATVTLASGERWRTVLDRNILRKLGLKEAGSDIEQHGEVRRIDFSPASTSGCRPAHHMKLLLEDGSQSFIDPAELSIAVEAEHTTFDLPVGALRALKFIFSDDDDDPDLILVRFPTGHVKRLRLRSRAPYLRARDCHGNKLKAYHRDIMGILSPVDTGQATAIGQQSLTDESHVTTRDGRTERIAVPLAIWELRTEMGTLSLPSPVVRTIRRLPDSPDEVELRTIFGEILKGRLATRELRITSETVEGYTTIDFDDVDELTASAPLLRVPDDWMVFYLSSGIAVVGRLADTPTGLVSNGDKAVAGNAVYSLTATPEDTFVVASKLGRIRTCQTKTRKASIVLLLNGDKLSIPWKTIHLAKTQRQVEEASLRNALLDRELSEEAGRRATDIPTTNTKAETLRLATAIGTLKVTPADIASIAVDRTRSQACITTIHGDALLVPMPSRKWFRQLQGADDYEFPEDEQFTIMLRKMSEDSDAKDAVRCRLLSGDILLGELAEQELTIRQKDTRSKTTAIAATELHQIRRDESGNLAFLLDSGTALVGNPKERNLAIRLFSTGTTNTIPFKDIEALVVGSPDLPPTTVFLPGLPASLTGGVLVQGGSFKQGSDAGMDDERPIHNVSVGSFFMDATELTRAQFAAFVRDSEYETAAEQAGSAITWRSPGFMQRLDDPVVCVSWSDAIAYCNWRSKKADLAPCYTIENEQHPQADLNASGYRLPTEAEWEFAARNRGGSSQYPWSPTSGETSARLANYRQRDTEANDGWEWTCPVKAFPANDLGIFGLGGNVWEWCEDWYFDRAYSALQNRTIHNPCITLDSSTSLTRRVMRGGSFRNNLDLLRCTSRGNGLPYAFASHVGFRCVRNAE